MCFPFRYRTIIAEVCVSSIEQLQANFKGTHTTKGYLKSGCYKLFENDSPFHKIPTKHCNTFP